MQGCKALYCPVDAPPLDVIVKVGRGKCFSDSTFLQRLLGAPSDNQERHVLWQDIHASSGDNVSLEVVCRDWHGLEAHLLTNPSAPHVQGAFVVLGCIRLRHPKTGLRCVSYDKLLTKASVLNHLQHQALLTALAKFVSSCTLTQASLKYCAEFIGRYLGKLLGLSGTFTEAVLKPVMYSLQAYQSQYLLTFRAPGRHGRNIVIDAALPTQSESEQRALTDVIVFEQTSWSWPGTFVHLANDGRHGQRTNRCNTKMQTRGHVVATRPIPSLDTNDPDWASSEILWDYTDGYWREVPEPL